MVRRWIDDTFLSETWGHVNGITLAIAMSCAVGFDSNDIVHSSVGRILSWYIRSNVRPPFLGKTSRQWPPPKSSIFEGRSTPNARFQSEASGASEGPLFPDW